MKKQSVQSNNPFVRNKLHESKEIVTQIKHSQGLNQHIKISTGSSRRNASYMQETETFKSKVQTYQASATIKPNQGRQNRVQQVVNMQISLSSSNSPVKRKYSQYEDNEELQRTPTLTQIENDQSMIYSDQMTQSSLMMNFNGWPANQQPRKHRRNQSTASDNSFSSNSKERRTRQERLRDRKQVDISQNIPFQDDINEQQAMASSAFASTLVSQEQNYESPCFQKNESTYLQPIQYKKNASLEQLLAKSPSKNEIITFAKIAAAKKIQKTFRAYLLWKRILQRAAQYQENKKVLKLQKILAAKVIVKYVKKWLAVKSDKNMKSKKLKCINKIQKWYKNLRKIKKIKRSKEKLLAYANGWRVRRCLSILEQKIKDFVKEDDDQKKNKIRREFLKQFTQVMEQKLYIQSNYDNYLKLKSPKKTPSSQMRSQSSTQDQWTQEKPVSRKFKELQINQGLDSGRRHSMISGSTKKIQDKNINTDLKEFIKVKDSNTSQVNIRFSKRQSVHQEGAAAVNTSTYILKTPVKKIVNKCTPLKSPIISNVFSIESQESTRGSKSVQKSVKKVPSKQESKESCVQKIQGYHVLKNPAIISKTTKKRDFLEVNDKQSRNVGSKSPNQRSINTTTVSHPIKVSSSARVLSPTTDEKKAHIFQQRQKSPLRNHPENTDRKDQLLKVQHQYKKAFSEMESILDFIVENEVSMMDQSVSVSQKSPLIGQKAKLLMKFNKLQLDIKDYMEKVANINKHS